MGTHYIIIFLKTFFLCLINFFWLRRVLVAAHGMFVEACGLLSSCGVQLFSLSLWCAGSKVRGLRSWGHSGSLLEACGLSCPAACGILVPRPGIEPASPALEGGFFTNGPPGKSLIILF